MLMFAGMELNHSFYFVAFFMGLFSSFHCLGMCGSIIGTLTLSLKPEIRANKTRLFPYVLNYNLGRIISYTLAGLLVGTVKAFLFWPLNDAQAYRFLQILSALVMCSAGLYIAGWLPKFAYIEKIGTRFWKLLEPIGHRLIPVRTRLQALLFGMVWGWIPCGLVYTALALAMTAGDIIQSGLTMLAFGSGTLPAVMGIGIITGITSRLSSMQRFKQLVGILFMTLALFSAFPWLNPMRVVIHH